MLIHERYLRREVVLATLLVLASFLGLFGFFDLINELDNLGRGNDGLEHAVMYTVLTMPGRGFASRVCASLVRAAGIPALPGVVVTTEASLRVDSGATVEELGILGGDHGALGAPADRASEVRQRSRARAAGQNEFLQWPELVIQSLQFGFQARHLFGLDQGVARHSQFATEVEQIVLDVGQQCSKVGRQRFAQQHAERAVQFVDVAQRVHTGTAFRHPRTIAQAGLATVTGACRNL